MAAQEREDEGAQPVDTFNYTLCRRRQRRRDTLRHSSSEKKKSPFFFLSSCPPSPFVHRQCMCYYCRALLSISLCSHALETQSIRHSEREKILLGSIARVRNKKKKIKANGIAGYMGQMNIVLALLVIVFFFFVLVSFCFIIFDFLPAFFGE